MSTIQVGDLFTCRSTLQGNDVHVHVIGREAVAVMIRSSDDVVDYRTAGGRNVYDKFDLPEEFRVLINGTEAQGLTFSGWDLRLSDSGESSVSSVTLCLVIVFTIPRSTGRLRGHWSG